MAASTTLQRLFFLCLMAETCTNTINLHIKCSGTQAYLVASQDFRQLACVVPQGQSNQHKWALKYFFTLLPCHQLSTNTWLLGPVSHFLLWKIQGSSKECLIFLSCSLPGQHVGFLCSSLQDDASRQHSNWTQALANLLNHMATHSKNLMTYIPEGGSSIGQPVF